MPNTHRSTRRNPSRRRRSTTADLRAKLEMAQLFIDMLTYVKPTPQQLLTRSQRLRLGDVSAKTGFTREQMMRRGVDMFLEIEAPVYLAHGIN